MTAEFDLGDNYSIDEDSNGDLVIRDGNGNTVLKHNNGTGKLTAPSQTVNSASDVAVKDYVDSVAQGLDWQDSVIDEQNDPPSSPNTGDRYLIDDNPTGDWSGEPNEIAEWDGSQWVFFDPNDGWAVFLEDVDLLKVYDSGQADWIAFGSAIDHGALAGLGDDDHTQYLLVDGSRNMSGSLDMGSNAITNASSVNTDEARIGTVPGEGDVFRLIGRETPSSDTGEIQFTGLSSDAMYKIVYSADVTTAGSKVLLRLNGDGATTGNYFYWDASATKQTGENEFLLYQLNDSNRIAGRVFVTDSQISDGRRTGINHQPLPGGIPSRFTDFGREGGDDNLQSLSSIEIIAEDNFNANETIVELWERAY